MLHNLKKTQKNHVFLDDDDMDIDNMDFPLPTDQPSSSSSSQRTPNLGGMGRGGMPDMAQLQKMMESLGGGGLGGMGGMGGLGGMGAPSPMAAPTPTEPKHVVVASGPGGQVRQLSPDQYKEYDYIA